MSSFGAPKELIVLEPPRWVPPNIFAHAYAPLPPFANIVVPLGATLRLPSINWGQVLFLVILLLLAAFASGSETALTSVEKLRIRHLADQDAPGSRAVAALMRDPNQFLTAILILNMVTIIVASGLATVLAGEIFGPGVDNGWGSIAISLVFSVVVLIVSEIIPKTLAIRTAEKTALRVAPVVALLARALSPFVYFFRGVTNLAMRVFGVKTAPGPFVSDEQLVVLATIGEEQGVFREEERRRIEAVVEFEDIAAHEVMVPRVDMSAIAIETSLGAAIDLALQVGHSRLPVYEKTVDNIVGVLYVWDMLRYARANRYEQPINGIMRPAYAVPESKSIGELFRELQLRRVHMAILLDEYGGTAGLVTIEDLLEQIVGEITDEHDPGEPQYIQEIAPHEYLFDGRTGIDEAFDLFDKDTESEQFEEFDTVGGLVFHNIGHVPLVGDEVRVDGLLFTVERMEGTRIAKVRALPAPAEPTENATENEPREGDDGREGRVSYPDVPTPIP